MKKIILTALMGISASGLIFTGCGETQNGEEIKIVYTNDIHSYVGNEIKNEAGEKEDGLRLSKIAQMVDDMEDNNENVLLVDAGDSVQGSVFGTYDKGKSIVELMNETGYQLTTPGNHDFDFGVDRLFELEEEADYTFLSCNFRSTEGEDTFKDVEILETGGKKIAFVGISTSYTITKSIPINFQDENGEFLYEVEGSDDPEDLYKAVQESIDSVKDEVDYVIALGHVGINAADDSAGVCSKDIIANTNGLDAFIDGHSHNVVEGEKIKDKSGKSVVLTQTGCNLENAGIMTIGKDGKISTELFNDYDFEDEKVAEMEDELYSAVGEKLEEKIAVLDTELTINDPESKEQRMIRSRELNIGDFITDGIYWTFNNKNEINCDITLLNSGSIRRSIDAGDVIISNVYNVQPFGNNVCLIKANGQQIKDALEMGVAGLDVNDATKESGGFLQVAGLKYSIDTSVPSSVKKDSGGMFVSVDGEYRVKDIQVYNSETGEYNDIDLNKEYTVGGIDYILQNSGDGMSMFKDCNVISNNVGIDVEITISYIKSFNKSGGYARLNTANSPLSKYSGYLLDYGNLYGSERITFIK